MEYKIDNGYLDIKKTLESGIYNFENEGENFGDQKRNALKLFRIKELILNVKSFKVPNLINRIAYRYFRKSKAQRSFEYANKLIELDIGTPQPIAYFQESKGLLFGKSYYVSEQLECDLTYRELINDFNYPDYEKILRAFTKFTFELHEKGVQFLDHSPGNTLITKTDRDYNFYLVDLNRMKFGTMNFETRMKNFARLSKYQHMVEIMSDEYAKCCGKSYNEVFEAMWKEVKKFRAKVDRKKRIKKLF